MADKRDEAIESARNWLQENLIESSDSDAFAETLADFHLAAQAEAQRDEVDGLKACAWTNFESAEDDTWQADCGFAFILNDGEKPTESGMKFCCGCGKSLVEDIRKDEDEDDEPFVFMPPTISTFVPEEEESK